MQWHGDAEESIPATDRAPQIPEMYSFSFCELLTQLYKHILLFILNGYTINCFERESGKGNAAEVVILGCFSQICAITSKTRSKRVV